MWSVAGSDAAGFLMTIYTFLSPDKKQQAKKALLEWRSRPKRPGWNVDKQIAFNNGRKGSHVAAQ